jgi:sugar phosphate isomerase/epimerase
MISRREFARQIAVAGSSVVGLNAISQISLSAAENKEKGNLSLVGLQLYTVRDLTKKDFAGTLKKVAEIGYDAVEFAGFGDLKAPEVKQLIAELKLKAAGSHEAIDRLQKEVDQVIEFNKTIGNHYVVCPYLPDPWQKRGSTGFKEFAGLLEAAGEKIKAAGLQLCYHNHNFEFKKEGEKYLLDFLFEACKADIVKAEVDAYWVKFAGLDPVEFLQNQAGRCKLIHMKDMTTDGKKSFAPVGTGLMDFKGIIQTARKTGVDWFIVEQDQTSQPVLEAITISLKNMRQLLKS